jgi:hypothetical protein
MAPPLAGCAIQMSPMHASVPSILKAESDHQPDESGSAADALA